MSLTTAVINRYSATRVPATLRLLRLPFSFFLLPIFLFTLYLCQPVSPATAVTVFMVWHLLVFPASNGYNSFHDRDTGPIGGLAAPPLPTMSLLYCVNVMDAVAVGLSFLAGAGFASFVLVYIISSRLYSNRR